MKIKKVKIIRIIILYVKTISHKKSFIYLINDNDNSNLYNNTDFNGIKNIPKKLNLCSRIFT